MEKKLLKFTIIIFIFLKSTFIVLANETIILPEKKPVIPKEQKSNKVANYLESLSDFGKNNHNWIFNLGHGFLPDIDYKKVKKTVNWIKSKNWNR